MKSSRYLVFVLLVFVLAGLTACSDDDPAAPGPPDDTGIKSVVVSPESATLSAIGEDIQFEATAFDGAGAVVDTVFQWQSSRTDVVAIGIDGVATATGIGAAEILATVGGVTDTATVLVDVVGGPVIEWAAATDGDWQSGANWSGGVVPGDGDVAVIGVPGSYTVSLGADVSVLGLILGSDTGTQTLATGGHTLNFTSGGLQGGAALDTDGTVRIQADLVWSGGTIGGGGTLEIANGAALNILGAALDLNADLDNDGEITIWADANLRVRSTLANNTGGLLELRGNATVSVFDAGALLNAGVLRKSEGMVEAGILASSAEFTSTGSIEVDAGILGVRGGTLRGFIDIAEGSVLRQSGTTEIPFVFFNGDGALEINGSVNFGTYAGQSIKIEHLILDSGVSVAVSGLASLRVDQSFVWRRGVIGDLYRFTTQFGATARFETSGTKFLSNTAWDVLGEVAGDGGVNLTLAHGADLTVGGQAKWTQVTGGLLKQGLGDTGGFHVEGEFHKTGEGAFVVETALDCAGTLNLVEGALTVQGEFALLPSGVITGGGTAEVNNNVRLILVSAPSATMAGTIRPDLDGQPARLAINGAVDLASSFTVELDLPLAGAIPAESLNFQRGGQVLNGTLALNVMRPPEGGTEYRVINMVDGSGQFGTITGGTAFTGIIQNDRGVLLTR